MVIVIFVNEHIFNTIFHIVILCLFMNIHFNCNKRRKLDFQYFISLKMSFLEVFTCNDFLSASLSSSFLGLLFKYITHTHKEIETDKQRQRETNKERAFIWCSKFSW